MPFFSFPLASLTGTAENIDKALVTLPLDQLLEEHRQLAAKVERAGPADPARLMLGLYEVEITRRTPRQSSLPLEGSP